MSRQGHNKKCPYPQLTSICTLNTPPPPPPLQLCLSKLNKILICLLFVFQGLWSYTKSGHTKENYTSGLFSPSLFIWRAPQMALVWSNVQEQRKRRRRTYREGYNFSHPSPSWWIKAGTNYFLWVKKLHITHNLLRARTSGKNFLAKIYIREIGYLTDSKKWFKFFWSKLKAVSSKRSLCKCQPTSSKVCRWVYAVYALSTSYIKLYENFYPRLYAVVNHVLIL